MLALSAIAAVLALVIAAWSIAGILTRFVTEGLDQRLDAQIAVMASAVRDDGTIDRARIDNQIGVMTLRPDWRWRIIGPDGEIGSSDFPTLDPAPLPPPLPPPPPARPRRKPPFARAIRP
ncbi:hypothetical protein ACFS32_12455 [Novosphingobium pokkalii]|uniref:hypothetical protein n=1 Tax=Novosphingobium pokkalii TaxID=1770194 RepID=UPI0036446E33